MLTAVPTGWLTLVKGCDCIPCMALCRAWDKAEPVVIDPEFNHTRLVITAREEDLLRAIGSGQSNKEIAVKLGNHEQTVKNALTLLFRKMGVQDRTQAALMAVELAIMDSHAWSRDDDAA